MEEIKTEEIPEEEREEEPKPKPAPKKKRTYTRRKKKMIPVQVVTKAGETALVQWHDGGARRAYIPAGEIAGKEAPADTLGAGIPYGAPWEEILKAIMERQSVTPEMIANALRGHGIWTAEDMERDPRNARRAIDGAVGISASELCRVARRKDRR